MNELSVLWDVELYVRYDVLTFVVVIPAVSTLTSWIVEHVVDGHLRYCQGWSTGVKVRSVVNVAVRHDERHRLVFSLR